MLLSFFLSLALPAIVLGVPNPPTGGGYSGSSGGGWPSGSSGGGNQHPYGYSSAQGYGQSIPEVQHGSGYGTQRGSTSQAATNYGSRGSTQQQNVQDGSRIAQSYFGNPTNRDVPQYNMRAGPHSGGSQGGSGDRGYTTVQAPANPRYYDPPPRNAGPYGAGSVAVHIPSAPTPGGTQRFDPSRPAVTQPRPGQQANQDTGKTSTFNPNNPYRSSTWKRDLGSVPDIVAGKEVMRRGLAIRELLERELLSPSGRGWE